MPQLQSHTNRLKDVMQTPQEVNQQTRDCLPGHLGIVFTSVQDGETKCELPVTQPLMANNGYLHAGSVVSLADSAAGIGCLASLPEGAESFTTIELKSNHVGTALDGTLECTGTIVHRGRTTQVWDSTVTHRETGKTIAVFRCTQMILYPRPDRSG